MSIQPVSMIQIPHSSDFLPADFSSLGFETIEAGREVARIVASTAAQEKSGKTHWGVLTWPDPMAVFSLDTGTRMIVEKALRSGRRIVYNKFLVPETQFKDDNKAKALSGAERKTAEQEWDRFKDSIRKVIEYPKLRSLIIDTATEMWELARMARFGKTTQVPPQLYVALNAEMRELLTSVYERQDLNVLFIHKMKKEYKSKAGLDKEVWSGRWERAGFGDLPYIVDMNLENYFNHETMRFGVRVLDCPRSNPQVIGQEFEDAADGSPMGAFPWMAVACFPDTDLAYWAPRGWNG